jgi:SAM-dependent methyltransferase
MDPRTEKYLAQRRLASNSFGYGLARRIEMASSMVDRYTSRIDAKKIDLIDFGCADGSMLEAVANRIQDRFGTGTGLDVFRAGLPTSADNRITFLKVDLFKNFPYPLPDSSQDVAIASSFFKHHPMPLPFLSELARVVRPGGVIVLLDPRPFVVRIGSRFGRFNPNYNPNLWTRDSLAKLLSSDAALSRLTLESYVRYWSAPSAHLYQIGFERLIPSSLANVISLHQCAILRHS